MASTKGSRRIVGRKVDFKETAGKDMDKAMAEHEAAQTNGAAESDTIEPETETQQPTQQKLVLKPRKPGHEQRLAESIETLLSADDRDLEAYLESLSAKTEAAYEDFVRMRDTYDRIARIVGRLPYDGEGAAVFAEALRRSPANRSATPKAAASAPKAPRAARKASGSGEHDAAVLKAAKGSGLGLMGIAEKAKLPKPVVSAALKRLRESKQLKQDGERRGATYS
jgi:hypothetical protein